MVQKSVVLTEQEHNTLATIAEQEGKTADEVLHDVIQHYLSTYLTERTANRLAAFEQAVGMWKERNDLPDFETLRREFDRFDTD